MALAFNLQVVLFGVISALCVFVPLPVFSISTLKPGEVVAEQAYLTPTETTFTVTPPFKPQAPQLYKSSAFKVVVFK